jgi:hypothetical protein
MNSDNIKSLTVRGYNRATKLFKLKIDFNEDDSGNTPQSQKIDLDWNNIIAAFKHVKKELNNDIYRKLIYTLCTSIVVKDKHYRTTKEFLFGVPCKKNNRKINDVQAVLNYLLVMKQDKHDSQAVDCIFKHAFNMFE